MVEPPRDEPPQPQGDARPVSLPAHEVNNQLAVVLNLAAVLAIQVRSAAPDLGAERTNRLLADIREIETAAERAAAIVQRLR